jgi:transmembrane sensor
MHAEIREAAVHWLVEFRTDTPDVAARRRFAEWLRTSPQHIHAYLDLLALWEDARDYDQQRRLDINTLIALARTDHTITTLRTDESPGGIIEIVPPENPDSRTIISRRTILRRLLRPSFAIAAVLSLLINGGVTWFAMDPQSVAYTTQIAEQRTEQLPDGSRVDLDALSNVRTNFTSHERSVELLSGQALFRVAKDTRHPFVVSVGDARVRAVGTEFNVNRTPLGTVVTVLGGRVVVFAAPAPKKHLFGFTSSDEAGLDWSGNPSNSRTAGVQVNAGQQTTITRSTIALPHEVDTAAATGWTRRLAIFIATPLAEVAEEFNRFNFRRIVIASPTLADFQVTGSFGVLDPQAMSDFVVFLRKQPGIEILEEGHQIIVQSHLAR